MCERTAATDIYVVHYGEIGLKGKNRELFERALVRNIERALVGASGEGEAKVRRRYSRIVVTDGSPEIAEVLRFIPGIRYFAQAKRTPLELEAIKAAALELAEVAGREALSFKVAARRTSKEFPLDSIELNRVVGAHIRRATGKEVSLEEPELVIYIEIHEDEAYLYPEKVQGIGGLPVGTAGRVVSLISGGIDSPVATFMMMKRGCEVPLAHFFNETLHSPQVRRKLERLAQVLTKVQPEIKLYMVPFGELQRGIIRSIPSRYRMLVYRRVMTRLADKIAEVEGAKALVTGDSLAQVASQTLDNLRVIYAAAGRPVLAPLIGFDKEETIKLAKEIGTYEISILPYKDCCSFMIAPHPETHGRLEVIEELERGMHLDLERALAEAEVKRFEVGGRQVLTPTPIESGREG